MLQTFEIIASNPVTAFRAATSTEKARQMGKQGYGLSQDRTFEEIFYIHRPFDAEGRDYDRQTFKALYLVNTKHRTCSCPDWQRNGGCCKHMAFVSLCTRYAARMAKAEEDAHYDRMAEEYATR